MTIADLDLSPQVAFSFSVAIARRQGLLLLCGPTGSGKTTTASALLAAVKAGRPVVDIWEATPATFVDADCVVDAGDIRSASAAQIAADLAGRALVIAVLRSGRSNGAVHRLVDWGVSKPVLKRPAPSVVTQQLCRLLCRHCRVASAAEDALRDLGIPVSEAALTSGYVYDAVGCELCTGGYSGFVPIFEVLVTSAAGASEEIDLRHESSLREDGLRKVLAGQTTLAELRRLVDFDGPR